MFRKLGIALVILLSRVFLCLFLRFGYKVGKTKPKLRECATPKERGKTRGNETHPQLQPLRLLLP